MNEGGGGGGGGGEREEYFTSCAQEFLTMQDEIDYEEAMKAAREVAESSNAVSDTVVAAINPDEPASPVRDEWPKDSLLTKDHFTIDTQKCLTCRKDLGHAMPMNRIPKEKYLFCGEACQNTAVLQCFACDKHFVRDQGHFVHRPGNCAYSFPTQIYNFMCKYCYDEQMATEPGFEETKQKMKEFREYRKQMEAADPHGKDIANLSSGSSTAEPSRYRRQPATTMSTSSSFSYFSGEKDEAVPLKKRKRLEVSGAPSPLQLEGGEMEL